MTKRDKRFGPRPFARLEPQPTLWVLDMDGTTLNPDHTLDPMTIETLAMAAQRGIQVVLATGRIYKSVQPYAAQINPTPVVISGGGQAIVRPGENVELLAYLTPDVADDVTARVADMPDVTVQMYTTHEQTAFRHNARSAELSDIEKLEFRPVDALPNPWPSDLEKIVFVGELNVVAEVNRRFIDHEGYHFVPSGPHYRDILPLGISKGRALQQWLDEESISDAVILAAGDHFNDVSLFEMAHWSVQVGDHCAELSDLATQRIHSNAHAALARALRELHGFDH